MTTSPFPPPPVHTPVVVGDEPDPLLERHREVQPYLPQDIINTIVLSGDLSKLTGNELTAYYVYRCRQLGLDPATKPFDVLTLQGKKILYANKSCAANLRALYKISTMVLEEREWKDLLIIRVRAWYPDGRQHEDEGFASIGNLKGDMLGNARLKAQTKATRRAILHLCGLGELDESEVDSIPGAKKSSAFAEAKAAIAIPQLPTTGSDVIQVVEVTALSDGCAIVLDAGNRTWIFDANAVSVAVAAEGRDTFVMIDYVVEDGKYVVHEARM